MPAGLTPNVLQNLFCRALCPDRISGRLSLLAATMNQKSSLREVPQFVSGVLTGNTRLRRRGGDTRRSGGESFKKVRLRALVYTSPSHTVAKPRWRILAPTSCDLPPQERTKLVAGLNGILGRILAPESFTLSQSYYYGSVNNSAEHRAVIVDGDYIDLRDDLDAGAIGKTEKNTKRVRGFEAHLALPGDGPGLEGFNGLLVSTGTASYAAMHGVDLRPGQTQGAATRSY